MLNKNFENDLKSVKYIMSLKANFVSNFFYTLVYETYL